MLRLFSKIRHSLIHSTGISRYLLYAIGEILLVVIGILIALQVNNWNESRKNDKREAYLLNRLEKEFVQDSTNLNNYCKLLEIFISNGHKVIDHLENREIQPLDSLARYLFFNGRILIFKVNSATYDEIVSTGQMNILKSEELKDYLAGIHAIMEFNESFMYSENTQRKSRYNEHLYKYFDPELMTYLWEKVYKGVERGDISVMPDKAGRTFFMNVEGFRSDPSSLYHVRNALGVDAELHWMYSEDFMGKIERILRLIRESKR